MTWRVLVTVGESEGAINLEPGDEAVRLSIDSQTSINRISHDVWETLGRNHLSHSPRAAIDLFRLASVVFSVDKRIPRDSALDSWTRSIDLQMPVLELELWRGATDQVEQLLKFLTGDVWSVSFWQTGTERPQEKRWRRTVDPLDGSLSVLFSGGLDSLVGASDALFSGEAVYLVSHNSAGSASHSSLAQDRLIRELGAHYGTENTRHLKFAVSPPPTGALPGSETTERSRSIVFLGLGTLVASSTQTPLVVAENGLISLNTPLATSRLGSHSTRTTHPETMRLFAGLLTALDLSVPVRTPYRHRTKGEMLDDAGGRSWLINTARRSVSCAHPVADRFQGASGLKSLHCGYCVPCLIRRAALRAVNADRPGDYRHDVLTEELEAKGKGADLRALRIALRAGKSQSALERILLAGPLPDSPEELNALLGVYERGMDELARFLAG